MYKGNGIYGNGIIFLWFFSISCCCCSVHLAPVSCPVPFQSNACLHDPRPLVTCPLLSTSTSVPTSVSTVQSIRAREGGTITLTLSPVPPPPPLSMSSCSAHFLPRSLFLSVLFQPSSRSPSAAQSHPPSHH